MHKKGKIVWIIVLIFLCILAACSDRSSTLEQENIAEQNGNSYAFFVAGHTYGKPGSAGYGMHPPFVKSISYLNDYPNMELGILTGDVVVKSTAAYWDSALVNINKFTVPIHIAPGNHDRGKEFKKRIEKSYYAFKHQNDLFIILSPQAWNIKGKQKEFLINTIQNKSKEVDHIFIFCHELIWWAPDNKFGGVDINYRPHYPGKTNFYEEVLPILDSLANEVLFFAGDLGCVASVDAYMYHKEGNITYIANGMGGGKEDNIIIVEVSADKSIQYRLLGINNTPPEEMGKLENFVLP